MAIPTLSTIEVHGDDEMEEALNSVADNSYLVVDTYEAKGYDEAISAIDDMIEALSHIRSFIEDRKKETGNG